LYTPGISLEDNFRSAAATVKNIGNRLAVYVYQLEFIGTSGYELPRWQTNENDWTNFTQLNFPLNHMGAAILEQILFIHHGYNHNIILHPVYPNVCGHLGIKNTYQFMLVWSNIRFR